VKRSAIVLLLSLFNGGKVIHSFEVIQSFVKKQMVVAAQDSNKVLLSKEKGEK
jgi:hypothetical protein